MTAPDGWGRVYGGQVLSGDLYWNLRISAWLPVETDMVGQYVDTFHGIARRRRW